MEIESNWKEIRKHFNKSFQTNLHVVIGSVDNDFNPALTPIGSLFLNHDQTGFYFEKYLRKLPDMASSQKNICVLAVNSSKWFWFKSLYRGAFADYPAIKLYGELGCKRIATDVEIQRMKARVRLTKWLKGHHYLWNDMNIVQEVSFTRAEKINLGKMTELL